MENVLPGDDNNHKVEHKKLASLIKGVHKHLRRKFRESNGDYASVWQDHSQDNALLKSYADAMKLLAQEHWSVYPESRIDWCYEVITDYFLSGGLKRALEKDAKHRFFEKQRKAKEKDDETSLLEREEMSQISSETSQNVSYPVNDSSHTHKNEKDSLRRGVDQQPEYHHSQHADCIDPANPPVPTPIRLLDVGSCYNPFRTYEHLESIAIDLCPADDSVFQCDFLQLDLIPFYDSPKQRGEVAAEVASNGFQRYLQNPIHQLPVCSFDVVVCCLLLEYLPSPIQRVVCCMKAVRLLHTNGLLLLITPDSKSSHRNAPMMKSWRSAIKAMGMVRWKYHKAPHLHCMAFRKVSHQLPDDTSAMEEELAPLMHIPQDFNDACYHGMDNSNTDTQDCLGTSGENEEFCSSVFEELPGFLCDLD